MAKIVEVIIGTSGEVKIDALGFKGIGCEQATEFLEQALGSVRGRSRKPEYHAKVKSQQRIGGAQ